MKKNSIFLISSFNKISISGIYQVAAVACPAAAVASRFGAAARRSALAVAGWRGGRSTAPPGGVGGAAGAPCPQPRWAGEEGGGMHVNKGRKLVKSNVIC